jgi:hypothetical protein
MTLTSFSKIGGKAKSPVSQKNNRLSFHQPASATCKVKAQKTKHPNLSEFQKITAHYPRNKHHKKTPDPHKIKIGRSTAHRKFPTPCTVARGAIVGTVFLNRSIGLKKPKPMNRDLNRPKWCLWPKRTVVTTSPHPWPLRTAVTPQNLRVRRKGQIGPFLGYCAEQ